MIKINLKPTDRDRVIDKVIEFGQANDFECDQRLSCSQYEIATDVIILESIRGWFKFKVAIQDDNATITYKIWSSGDARTITMIAHDTLRWLQMLERLAAVIISD